MAPASLEIRVAAGQPHAGLGWVHVLCATLRRNGGAHADAPVVAYVSDGGGGTDDCRAASPPPWADAYGLRIRRVDAGLAERHGAAASRLAALSDPSAADAVAVLGPGVLVRGDFARPVRWALDGGGVVGRVAGIDPADRSSWPGLAAAAGVVEPPWAAIDPGWGVEGTLGSPAVPVGYLDPAVVFASSQALGAIGDDLLGHAATASEWLPDPAAQAALALAVTRCRVPVLGMPLRYSMVASEPWLAAYPLEARTARLCVVPPRATGLDDGYVDVDRLLSRRASDRGAALASEILQPVGRAIAIGSRAARAPHLPAGEWVAPALLVIGMHRSGSSLVGRRLEGLGLVAGLGDPLPAAMDNPRGFAETEDLKHLHDGLLAELAASWDAPPCHEPATLQRALADLDHAAVSVVRARLTLAPERSAPWFVKDPRATFLVGAWDRASLAGLPVVVCVRPPEEVAHSLMLRDGLTPRRALALWLHYTRTAAAWSSGRPSLVVDYPEHLKSPERVEAALSAWLRGIGVDPPRSGPWPDSVVEGRLRRAHGGPVGRDEPEALEWCTAVYRILAAASLGPVPDGIATEPLPAWAGWELSEARRTRRGRRRGGERLG